MNRIKKIVDTTTDSRTYKIALKGLRERHGDIRCSICGYHRGCNHNNKTFKAKKGWKEGTKRKTQYKSK